MLNLVTTLSRAVLMTALLEYIGQIYLICVRMFSDVVATH